MIVSETFARLGAELAARPLFWLVLIASLVFVTLCSHAWFGKKWLRASISGLLAVQGVWLLCSGFLA